MAQAAGPQRLERAMIAIALPAALGPILGSVLGGVIVESWSWHWIFLVNVPVCVVALVLGYRSCRSPRCVARATSTCPVSRS